MSKSGNSIFVTTNAMQIAAINDKTGAIVWVTNLLDNAEAKKKFFKRKQSKDPMVLLQPVVVNDSLFVGAASGKLYKLSPYDGKIVDTIDIAKDAKYVMVTGKLNIFTKTHRLVSR
jgi:outer membrane protein assembly factor BamB